MTCATRRPSRPCSRRMPYIRRFWGATVVLKYGGAAMTRRVSQEQFAEDMVLLRLVGMRPVVVHGGGPEISRQMERLGMEPDVRRRPARDRRGDHGDRQDGAGRQGEQRDRRPDQPARRHGRRDLRRGRPAAQGRAQGAPRRAGNEVDLGFVGEVDAVNTEVLDLLAKANIPVVASVGADDTGEAYNVNADTVAGEIAAALTPRRSSS